ncbi:SpaA isopeptide-forming pilin-related protein [Schleiferilactobacillus harbinensis]|uniref:SpaA isopeptide-forming pilin-related protein n=1 Tax=Schleiferilactobacillus harbinensis TaxID=304207 RepID=UPI0039EB7C55
MKTRRTALLSCWTILLLLLGGFWQAGTVKAADPSQWHQHTYGAPFNSSPFVSADRMLQVGDEGNIFLYNVVLSGNHSADSADTEGALAIQGNSTVPAVDRNGGISRFNYAGFFDGGNHGNGDGNSHPLSERHRISLLLGGEIRKYYPVGAQDKGHALVSGQGTNNKNSGYFVVRKEAVLKEEGQNANPWLQNANNPVFANGRVYHTDDFASGKNTVKMDDIFTRIFASQRHVENELTQLVGEEEEKGDPYTVDGEPYTVESFWGWWGNSIDVPVYHSKKDASTLIIDIPAKPGTDTAYMPGFKNNAPPIQDSSIKRIIFTTSQPKVIANSGDKSRQVAEKTIYWLPKAEQVTNYGNPDWSAPVVPEVNDGPENRFTQAYFNKMHCFSTALSGSLIAPVAKVVWSGAHINGYLWAKDFQQSGGAEAHNFYTPPLEELVDFMIGVNKHNADDHIPVANAEFILYRTAAGKTEYLTKASPETWSTERDQAIKLTTNSDGQIRVQLKVQKETQYRYYFHETKAPPGFQPPPADNAHEVSPNQGQTIGNISEVPNVPILEQEVGFHKTNQFGSILPDIKFTLTAADGKTFEAVSDKTGYIEFNGVTPGEYKLKEETKNAIGPTEWDVTIVIVDGKAELRFKDGDKIDTIVNQKRLSLRLTKVDENGQILRGAKFRLQGPNGYDQTRPEDEQEIGIFLFNGLGPGEYTLTEVEAPEGYDKLEKPIKIVVSDDMKTITVDGKLLGRNGLVFGDKVQNKPVGVLPATGGWGMLPWYLTAGTIGFAAINVGVGYYGKQRRGREK